MSQPALNNELYPRPLSEAPVSELPSARVPARQPLMGQYATLEPLDAQRHAESLYKAGHENAEALKIWDYLSYGPWPNVASYSQVLRQQSASLEPIFFAIRDSESGEVCGQASFLDLNPSNGVIEIGHIWFGLQLQKTRAATEALYLMIRYAMDDLGYRRMEWRCNSMNKGSRLAAQRLGFRFEGIFYNHMIFKGKNRDTAWFSILDNEWPSIRSVFQQWLSSDNFNHDGMALTSLSEKMAQRAADAWDRTKEKPADHS